MSRNGNRLLGTSDFLVTSREGRVSRNVYENWKEEAFTVTSREGRVSRNSISWLW